MIVSCPSCETKFAIPDAVYAPGRKARCSRCAHVFPLPEPALESEMPDFSPQETAFSQGAGQSAFADHAGDATDMAEGGPDAPLKSRRMLKYSVLALAVLICLGGLGYGAYFFYTLRHSGAASAAKSPDATQQELVRLLALANVRQYMITNNERVGRMAVVEGKVINNFAAPKELIRIEATLYDEKGNVLATRQQYVGVVLSLFQLQVLSKDELTRALENRIEILSNNVNVQPGGEVPFMSIFFDPPEGAFEFSVRIIDAKDPPAPAKQQ